MRTSLTGPNVARGTIGVALACAVGLAACGDPADSTQYDVRNETRAAVVIQFGGTSDSPTTRSYEVPAGSRMRVTLGQGPTWRGRLAVLDVSCNVMFEDQIDTRGGSLTIGTDAAVAWSSEVPLLGPDETRPPDAPDTKNCGR
jgi:hypothetical protein